MLKNTSDGSPFEFVVFMLPTPVGVAKKFATVFDQTVLYFMVGAASGSLTAMPRLVLLTTILF